MLINEAVLHILDKNSGNLLLSQAPLPLGDPFLIEYMTKLVEKVKKGDPHVGQLSPNEPLLGFLADESLSFLEKTQQLSDKLFAIIAPAEEIGAADYLFFTGTNDAGGSLFGMIRLDYSSKVTHYVDYEGEAVVNTLLQNHAILPNATQKPSEAFLVDLSNGNYYLIEKKVVIEGQKTAYFSEKFLEMTVPVTTKDQIKEIKKAVTHIAKKHDEEPYKALATTQQAIFHQLEEQDEIDAAAIFDKVFEEKPLARQAAQQAITEERVPEKISVTNVPKYERKYSKQKFKLDNGIEITIPSEIYENKDMVEFINNPDGSVSVLIKNIETIMNKFNA